mmetsp:Transcript_25897/g.4389  ORF Transcript_25897/g.4389 Transcript_25897/m.4389 type:complete len:108 (-) Transcript_25897:1955-2278(-)
MCMPSGSSNEFGSTTRLYYRISNMANPEWGISRSQEGTFAWNFDVNDSNVFTSYDIWTNQYDVLAYDAALDRLIARSYQDVNNAYHGFLLKSRGFKVNNYVEKGRSD